MYVHYGTSIALVVDLVILRQKILLMLQKLKSLEFLRYLNLRGNSLTGAVPREALADDVQLPELQWLNLSANRATTLSSWQTLFPALLVLILDNNDIKDAEVNPVINHYSLQVLSLRNNAIESMKPIANLSLPSLRVLDVDHNCLKSLEGIKSLAALQHVSVRFNYLKGDIGRLEGQNKCDLFLPCLRTFRADSNAISDVSCLHRCGKMERLYLAHNSLTSVPQFPMMANSLQVLDLSHNEISKIGAIQNLKALKVLRLHHNNISSLNEVLESISRKRLPELRELDLFPNPLNMEMYSRRIFRHWLTENTESISVNQPLSSWGTPTKKAFDEEEQSQIRLSEPLVSLQDFDKHVKELALLGECNSGSMQMREPASYVSSLEDTSSILKSAEYSPSLLWYDQVSDRFSQTEVSDVNAGRARRVRRSYRACIIMEASSTLCLLDGIQITMEERKHAKEMVNTMMRVTELTKLKEKLESSRRHKHERVSEDASVSVDGSTFSTTSQADNAENENIGDIDTHTAGELTIGALEGTPRTKRAPQPKRNNRNVALAFGSKISNRPNTDGEKIAGTRQTLQDAPANSMRHPFRAKVRRSPTKDRHLSGTQSNNSVKGVDTGTDTTEEPKEKPGGVSFFVAMKKKRDFISVPPQRHNPHECAEKSDQHQNEKIPHISGNESVTDINQGKVSTVENPSDKPPICTNKPQVSGKSGNTINAQSLEQRPGEDSSRPSNRCSRHVELETEANTTANMTTDSLELSQSPNNSEGFLASRTGIESRGKYSRFPDGETTGIYPTPPRKKQPEKSEEESGVLQSKVTLRKKGGSIYKRITESVQRRQQEQSTPMKSLQKECIKLGIHDSSKDAVYSSSCPTTTHNSQDTWDKLGDRCSRLGISSLQTTSGSPKHEQPTVNSESISHNISTPLTFRQNQATAPKHYQVSSVSFVSTGVVSHSNAISLSSLTHVSSRTVQTNLMSHHIEQQTHHSQTRTPQRNLSYSSAKNHGTSLVQERISPSTADGYDPIGANLQTASYQTTSVVDSTGGTILEGHNIEQQSHYAPAQPPQHNLSHSSTRNHGTSLVNESISSSTADSYDPTGAKLQTASVVDRTGGTNLGGHHIEQQSQHAPQRNLSHSSARNHGASLVKESISPSTTDRCYPPGAQLQSSFTVSSYQTTSAVDSAGGSSCTWTTTSRSMNVLASGTIAGHISPTANVQGANVDPSREGVGDVENIGNVLLRHIDSPAQQVTHSLSSSRPLGVTSSPFSDLLSEHQFVTPSTRNSQFVPQSLTTKRGVADSGKRNIYDTPQPNLPLNDRSGNEIQRRYQHGRLSGQVAETSGSEMTSSRIRKPLDKKTLNELVAVAGAARRAKRLDDPQKCSATHRTVFPTRSDNIDSLNQKPLSHEKVSRRPAQSFERIMTIDSTVEATVVPSTTQYSENSVTLAPVAPLRIASRESEASIECISPRSSDTSDSSPPVNPAPQHDVLTTGVSEHQVSTAMSVTQGSGLQWSTRKDVLPVKRSNVTNSLRYNEVTSKTSSLFSKKFSAAEYHPDDGRWTVGPSGNIRTNLSAASDSHNQYKESELKTRFHAGTGHMAPQRYGEFSLKSERPTRSPPLSSAESSTSSDSREEPRRDRLSALMETLLTLQISNAHNAMLSDSKQQSNHTSEETVENTLSPGETDLPRSSQAYYPRQLQKSSCVSERIKPVEEQCPYHAPEHMYEEISSREADLPRRSQTYYPRQLQKSNCVSESINPVEKCPSNEDNSPEHVCGEISYGEADLPRSSLTYIPQQLQKSSCVSESINPVEEKCQSNEDNAPVDMDEESICGTDTGRDSLGEIPEKTTVSDAMRSRPMPVFTPKPLGVERDGQLSETDSQVQGYCEHGKRHRHGSQEYKSFETQRRHSTGGSSGHTEGESLQSIEMSRKDLSVDHGSIKKRIPLSIYRSRSLHRVRSDEQHEDDKVHKMQTQHEPIWRCATISVGIPPKKAFVPGENDVTRSNTLEEKATCSTKIDEPLLPVHTPSGVSNFGETKSDEPVESSLRVSSSVETQIPERQPSNAESQYGHGQLSVGSQLANTSVSPDSDNVKTASGQTSVYSQQLYPVEIPQAPDSFPPRTTAQHHRNLSLSSQVVADADSGGNSYSSFQRRSNEYPRFGSQPPQMNYYSSDHYEGYNAPVVYPSYIDSNEMPSESRRHMNNTNEAGEFDDTVRSNLASAAAALVSARYMLSKYDDISPEKENQQQRDDIAHEQSSKQKKRGVDSSKELVGQHKENRVPGSHVYEEAIPDSVESSSSLSLSSRSSKTSLLSSDSEEYLNTITSKSNNKNTPDESSNRKLPESFTGSHKDQQKKTENTQQLVAQDKMVDQLGGRIDEIRGAIRQLLQRSEESKQSTLSVDKSQTMFPYSQQWNNSQPTQQKPNEPLAVFALQRQVSQLESRIRQVMEVPRKQEDNKEEEEYKREEGTQTDKNEETFDELDNKLSRSRFSATARRAKSAPHRRSSTRSLHRSKKGRSNSVSSVNDVDKYVYPLHENSGTGGGNVDMKRFVGIGLNGDVNGQTSTFLSRTYGGDMHPNTASSSHPHLATFVSSRERILTPERNERRPFKGPVAPADFLPSETSPVRLQPDSDNKDYPDRLALPRRKTIRKGKLNEGHSPVGSQFSDSHSGTRMSTDGKPNKRHPVMEFVNSAKSRFIGNAVRAAANARSREKRRRGESEWSIVGQDTAPAREERAQWGRKLRNYGAESLSKDEFKQLVQLALSRSREVANRKSGVVTRNLTSQSHSGGATKRLPPSYGGKNTQRLPLHTAARAFHHSKHNKVNMKTKSSKKSGKSARKRRSHRENSPNISQIEDKSTIISEQPDAEGNESEQALEELLSKDFTLPPVTDSKTVATASHGSETQAEPVSLPNNMSAAPSNANSEDSLERSIMETIHNIRHSSKDLDDVLNSVATELDL